MTDINRDELRRLCGEAKGGQWGLKQRYKDSWDVRSSIKDESLSMTTKDRRTWVATARAKENAALIAAMRNALPALLDLLDECEGVMTKVNDIGCGQTSDCASDYCPTCLTTKLLAKLRATREASER